MQAVPWLCGIALMYVELWVAQNQTPCCCASTGLVQSLLSFTADDLSDRCLLLHSSFGRDNPRANLALIKRLVHSSSAWCNWWCSLSGFCTVCFFVARHCQCVCAGWPPLVASFCQWCVRRTTSCATKRPIANILDTFALIFWLTHIYCITVTQHLALTVPQVRKQQVLPPSYMVHTPNKCSAAYAVRLLFRLQTCTDVRYPMPKDSRDCHRPQRLDACWQYFNHWQ